MIKSAILEFATQVNRAVPDFLVRQEILPYAIGFAIAQGLPFPASAEIDAGTFFDASHANEVKAAIAEFNEVTVFDTNIAKQAALTLFRLRHRAAFPTEFTAGFLNNFSIFDSLFGVADLVSVQEHTLLTKNGQALRTALTLARRVLNPV